jgi:hypothetical protein
MYTLNSTRLILVIRRKKKKMLCEERNQNYREKRVVRDYPFNYI